jgi:hypothetical protein
VLPRDPRSAEVLQVVVEEFSRGARMDLPMAGRLGECPAGRCAVHVPAPRLEPLSGSSNTILVGAPGFEPGTSATRTQRSTGLSHAPEQTGLNRGRGGMDGPSYRRLASCRAGASRVPFQSLGSNPLSDLLRRSRGFECYHTPNPNGRGGIRTHADNVHTISNRAP